jgi:hypothetical protein
MFSAGHSARGVLAAVVLLLLLGTGCVDFEQQAIVAVFPDNSPEVRVLLVYEGIGISGDKPIDLTKAKDQFTRFIKSGQQFCIFGNWPFHFELNAKDGDDADTRHFRAFLREHLMVDNGAMYRNTEGKLCGYQTVTIRDRNKFVKGVNEQVSAGFCRLIEEKKTDDNSKLDDVFDEASIRLIHRSAKDGFQWFVFDPGRLSFTLPATELAIRNLKREFLLNEIKRMENKDIELLVTTPLSFQHSRDRFTISLGVGDGEPVHVALPPGKSLKRDTEIATLAEELKVPFRGSLETAALVNDFVKNKGRIKTP